MEGKSIEDTLLDAINEEYNEVKAYSLDYRKDYVNRITDDYLESQDKIPPVKVLNRLSDLLLHDYVEGDSRSNKTQAVEYSILSEAQYLRRTVGQNQSRQKHGVTYVESPIDDITTLGQDRALINLDFLEDIAKDLD